MTELFVALIMLLAAFAGIGFAVLLAIWVVGAMNANTEDE